MTEYERGDSFEEDLSYLSNDGMPEFIREHRTVYEIQKVLEDKDTRKILYCMQSVGAFET